MSMQEPVEVGGDDEGSLMALPAYTPYTDQKMESSMSTGTPDLTNGFNNDEVGPVSRISGQSSIFSNIDLRSFALQHAEIATALKTRRQEMYRNNFPVFVPEFRRKCTDCGAEYDKEVTQCEECESEQLRKPSESQKTKYRRFFRDINGQGDSLRSLMQYEEDVQSILGVSTLVVRKEYEVRENPVNGKYVVPDDIKEVIHADPLNLVPVVNEDGRRGGWFTCPKHRGEEIKTKDEVVVHEGECLSECEKCGIRLEEVHYIEGVNDYDDNEFENIYFDDEVVQWSRHYELIQGIDGMSPVMPLIRLQSIISFSRKYDMAMLDPENVDLPNKLLLVYTTDPDSLRSSISKEEEKSEGNPLRTGKLVQQIQGDDDSSRVEMLDLTPQELLKSRDQKIQELEGKIRSMFNLPDAMDNEMSTDSGWDSTGAQLEIADRGTAVAQRDTVDKCLKELCNMVGLTDWYVDFVDPSREREEPNTREEAQTMQSLRQNGIPYRYDDDKLKIEDHDFDPTESEESDSGQGVLERLDQRTEEMSRQLEEDE